MTMPSEVLAHLPEILASLALIPDRYKERAFRYIGKLLPSSLSKPQYLEMLKAQAEQRLSSINESRLLNVCQVCQRAGEILGETNPNIHLDNDDHLYEDDWLNTFESEACQKSSEEMQERFARVLAGEIKNPGTFSIRAIKLLGEIDSETASTFKTFCSGCVSFDNPIGSGIIYTSFFPKFNRASSNVLRNYGLNDRRLSQLQEFSLLHTDATSSPFRLGFSRIIKDSFMGNIEKPLTPLLYANNYFLLKSHNDEDEPDWDFKIPGILLSLVGQELMNIVEPEPIEQLTEDLKSYFAEKQLELVEVEILDDGQAKLIH